MPPIRTFNSAPINQNTSPTAAKQENNATPSEQDEQQQQQQQQQQQSTPFAAPATPTAALTSGNINPSAARPGASAVPGPTAAPVPSPTKTYPLFDANSNTNTNNPPAPQPGARPVPPAAVAAATTPTSKTAYTVPPPPKTGEPVQPAEYYAPKTQTTASPTPARYATQSGVFMGGGGTNVIAQEEGIITTTSVPNSTSTPYMSTYQPPSAQPLPSASRFASIVGNANTNTSSSNYAGPLYAGNDGEESILGESGQKVFDTAKSWVQSAGSKLAEAEAEVWKMVNSK